MLVMVGTRTDEHFFQE